MSTSPQWIALPVEGARLQSCRIESSAKDGELTLRVDGHVLVHIGLSSSISFSSMNGVKQRFVAIDDNWIELVIEPADKPVRVVEAKIDYWLDEPADESFAEAMQETKWDLPACFDVRLGFELE